MYEADAARRIGTVAGEAEAGAGGRQEREREREKRHPRIPDCSPIGTEVAVDAAAAAAAAAAASANSGITRAVLVRWAHEESAGGGRGKVDRVPPAKLSLLPENVSVRELDQAFRVGARVQNVSWRRAASGAGTVELIQATPGGLRALVHWVCVCARTHTHTVAECARGAA
jgi:hypothetical protein